MLTLTLEDGPEAGSVVTLPEINLDIERYVPDLSVGEQVVLGYEDSTNTYFYATASGGRCCCGSPRCSR